MKWPRLADRTRRSGDAPALVAGHSFPSPGDLPVRSNLAASTAISGNLFSWTERGKHSGCNHGDLLHMRIDLRIFLLLRHAVKESRIQVARAEIGIAQYAAK